MLLKLNKEIAEIAGVIAGDGHLHNKANRITITGSLDDIYYYKDYLIPQFIRNFKVSPLLHKRPDKNSYCLVIENKEIFSFFINQLGMPRGNKHNKVLIPNKIIKNKEFSKAFLRGLFDTAGCIKFSKQNKKESYYPRIRLCCQISPMADQIGLILKNLRVPYSKYFDNRKNHINLVYEISGFVNTKNWFNLIGSSNLVHLTKFLFVEKKMNYIPHLNLTNRLKILDSSIYEFSQGKLFKRVY